LMEPPCRASKRARTADKVDCATWLPLEMAVRVASFIKDDGVFEASIRSNLWGVNGHALRVHRRAEGTKKWTIIVRNDLETLRHIYERRTCRLTCGDLSVFAAQGHIEGTQWVLARLSKSSVLTCKPVRKAIKGGHLALAQWLCERILVGDADADRMIECAAKCSHGVDTITWLCKRYKRAGTIKALFYAAARGDIAMVDYLYGLCPENAVSYRLGTGFKIECHRLDVDGEIGDAAAMLDDGAGGLVDVAAQNGHYKLFSHLVDEDIGFYTRNILMYALQGGDARIVESVWARKRQVAECIHPWRMIETPHGPQDVRSEARLLAAAVRTGSVTMVALLCHVFGIKPTTEAMEQAAKCGIMDIIEYLHGHHKVPVTEAALEGACAAGSGAAFRLLLGYMGKPVHNGAKLMREAARSGDVALVTMVHRLCGQPFGTDAVKVAATCGHVGVLRAMPRGIVSSRSQLVDDAVMHHQVQTLRYLLTDVGMNASHNGSPIETAINASSGVAVVRCLCEEGGATATLRDVALCLERTYKQHKAVARYLLARLSQGTGPDPNADKAFACAINCGDAKLASMLIPYMVHPPQHLSPAREKPTPDVGDDNHGGSGSGGEHDLPMFTVRKLAIGDKGAIAGRPPTVKARIMHALLDHLVQLTDGRIDWAKSAIAYHAIIRGRPYILDWLLERGLLHVDESNEANNVAWRDAIIRAVKGDQCRMVEWLLEHGFGVHVPAADDICEGRMKDCISAWRARALDRQQPFALRDQ